MKILVIEDERKVADAIKKGLEQESFAVDVCYDGKQGLSYAQTEEYDVVVLDWMLPSMDGITVCRTLRNEGYQIPILILTAKDQTADKVGGLNSGADDYLAKPFAFKELVARIKALSRRPQKSIGTILTTGGLILDTITYEVRRNDVLIQLSAKEYALLEYLMRNSGRTVTKAQIMANVWDFDADILPNTVEVYIGYLRNKIDKPFKDKPLIQTIRGFGYRIGA